MILRRAGDRELKINAACEYGCVDGARSERETVEGPAIKPMDRQKLVVASLIDAVEDVRPQVYAEHEAPISTRTGACRCATLRRRRVAIESCPRDERSSLLLPR